MHEAAKLRPVVIDESLTDLGKPVVGARDGLHGRGFEGVQRPIAGDVDGGRGAEVQDVSDRQDLTCPGASVIHSVGIAARVPGVAGVEANSRQYMPAANKPWEKRFPGSFIVKDGTLRTESLNGKGLSAVGK